MIAAAYVCFLPAMLSPFPAFLFARGVGGLPLPVLPIVRRNPTKPSAALSSPPTVKIYEGVPITFDTPSFRLFPENVIQIFLQICKKKSTL
jgi:hypothetical protein